MTLVCDIDEFLDRIAPYNSAMDYDNIGLLVGNCFGCVTKAVLSLDITPQVVQEAKEFGAQLIISHHPVIFKPIKRVNWLDIPYMLIKNEISAICVHTNLDMSPKGVNTCLAQQLGLLNIEGIKKHENTILFEGLIGELDREYSPKEFAHYVKEKLHCGGLNYVDAENTIRTVAICSGAGGDLLAEASRHGADAFVTGETKHHEHLIAAQMGITLVNAGHFNSEDVVIPPLLKILSKEFPKVEFIKSKQMQDPLSYL